MRLRHVNTSLIALAFGLVAASCAVPRLPLPTGRFITPQGVHTSVGTFPANVALSPDGQFLVVSNAGKRNALSVLSTTDGRLVSQFKVATWLGVRGGKGTTATKRTARGGKDGLFYGLAFGPSQPGGMLLYASHGQAEVVEAYLLSPQGQLTLTDRRLACPSRDKNTPNVIAGLALDSRGQRLYATNNTSIYKTGLKGTLLIMDTRSGALLRSVELPGYPFAVAALTRGPGADRKVYVSGERDGLVSVIDPDNGKVLKEIATGSHPIALLLDRPQQRLFVANGDSDTISVIDTARDEVSDTILLRPEDVRGLPGVVPTGLALAPDGRRLYATLGEMNAVAVIDLSESKPATLAGYLPVGWYPTALAVTPDGRRLMVANAKGTVAPNPNNVGRGPDGAWGQYILDILDGNVSTFALPGRLRLWGTLVRQTRQVIGNNQIAPEREQARPKMANPGIKHVIYIIKENRTYDQVFGDLAQGNGDPSQCLFPRAVTPNQHALAERFVLLDNFYVCAEVSAQGWGWSTAGMLSEYTERNTAYNYAGFGRSYDYEGQNNLMPVDLLATRDVATPPCGYIWDLALNHGLSLRNYGFFVNLDASKEKTAAGRDVAEDNQPLRRSLVGKTDVNFRKFGFDYTDSDAWVRHHCPIPRQVRAYGEFGATSRVAEWKREFDQYVKDGNLPAFETIRMGRNHTQGTTVGVNSPRSMVADNDYAVGELVEAVSHSLYWRDTAICILEDDAQNGHDHVDAHRSPALVISPFIKKGTVDHRFFNTDSMLRTMEELLGLPPLNQYDAAAQPIAVFGKQPANDAPYNAILPAREIIAEVNGRNSYKAALSAKLDFSKEDAVPDPVLNDLIWHAIKGASVPEPPIRHGLRLAAAERDDD